MVASLAAGLKYSVTSDADLALLKFRNAAKNTFNPDSDEYKYRYTIEIAMEYAFS